MRNLSVYQYGLLCLVGKGGTTVDDARWIRNNTLDSCLRNKWVVVAGNKLILSRVGEVLRDNYRSARAPERNHDMDPTERVLALLAAGRRRLHRVA